ncbi:MAG: hypothetical protein GYB33_06370 [Gammaproteobacteria bacterium]|nr:hypothetical protein [Gammaproteobacteria bacterium]
MKSKKVSTVEEYSDPMASGWSQVETEVVKMMPTPMAMQPTSYIRNSRKDIPHGQVAELRAKSVHDGETLAMHLSWLGVSAQDRDFPDAAAVAFPVKGEPILVLMGSKDAPLHILHWKANKGVKSMQAAGIGLSDPGPALKLSSKAHAEGDRWHLVLTRPLGKGMGIAPLFPGIETKVGFAIWSGANDERAGLKAFSIDWKPFNVDA